jgi:clan AA aspartic protease
MGLIYADIRLINGEDLILAKRNIIGNEEVKEMTIKMLFDTGAYMLAINENIQEQLKFPIIEKRKAQMANGSIEAYDVVGPVEVRFGNRQCTCRAMVLPGDNEPLLGAQYLWKIWTF